MYPRYNTVHLLDIVVIFREDKQSKLVKKTFFCCKSVVKVTDCQLCDPGSHPAETCINIGVGNGIWSNYFNKSHPATEHS